MHTRMLFAGLGAASLTVLSACGSSTSPAGSSPSADPSMSSGMSMPTSGASTSSTGGMRGMPMTSGTGLSATVNGYTITLHGSQMAGMPMTTTFTITKNGKTVTAFDPEQTKLMHFYLIRSDLTGFQHLHPTMTSDGTWSVTPAALTAGSYRIYVQFVPHADAAAGALVLSRPFTIPGPAVSIPVPAPTGRTTVDGYTLTLTGTLKSGTESPLRITVTKNGTPVNDLQPYLDSYAHVTAIGTGT